MNRRMMVAPEQGGQRLAGLFSIVSGTRRRPTREMGRLLKTGAAMFEFAISNAQFSVVWIALFPQRPALMYSKTHLKNAIRLAELALAPFLLISAALSAQTTSQTVDAIEHFEQDAPIPQPVPGVPNLMRLEGIDAESGIHYVRLLLSLPAGADASTAAPPPRFTIECQENNGKRDLWWFASFGGVTDSAFVPPFHATKKMPNAPKYPNVNIKMTFEGYIKWKPFIKGWAVLRSGELKYQNPGMGSPNMESPRYFMQYLNSLPGLRLSYAKPAGGNPPEVFFQAQPILDEMKKTPACGP
jgi:hypothetical protein